MITNPLTIYVHVYSHVMNPNLLKAPHIGSSVNTTWFTCVLVNVVAGSLKAEVARLLQKARRQRRAQ